MVSTVKIAHISDQHFDQSSRWDEHIRIMGWIANRLADEPPDLITLGGDLFERRPTPAETSAAAEWVMALADVAPVAMVYGNHDVPGSLDVMQWLRTRHPVHVAWRPMTIPVAGVALHCLPWPRRGEMAATADGAAPREETALAAVKGLRNVLRHFGYEARAMDLPGVLLGHAMVRGSSVSTGQPLVPGSDFEIGVEDLALAEARAYLLGHIHMGQEWTTADGAPVIYPGSPRRTAWGEIEPKGYVTVEVGRAGVSRAWVFTPATPMLLVGGRFDGNAIQLDRHPEGVAGADIRVRYSVAADAREAGRAAARRLRDSLVGDGAAVVRLEERVDAAVAARAPEVIRARTIAEKLRAMWPGRGAVLAGAREARLLRRLAELEAEHEV